MTTPPRGDLEIETLVAPPVFRHPRDSYCFSRDLAAEVSFRNFKNDKIRSLLERALMINYLIKPLICS